MAWETKKTDSEAPRSGTLRELLEQYIAEVEAAPLADLTKRTYILHATNFVRWTEGDFEPGSRAKK